MALKMILCHKPSTLKNQANIFRNYYYSTARFQTEQSSEWRMAIKEAETVVGYPTSFLNLRWLLNDEIANIASHVRNLWGTDHPLLKTVKNVVFKPVSPKWGLVVLLISRTVGAIKKSDMECDITSGILHSQRSLAEIIEMMHTSILIHKAIFNIDRKCENVEDLHYGNKLALLSGDYLLSKCFRDTACIRNQVITDIVSSSLKDLTEGQFLGQRDDQNMPLPSKPQKSDCSNLVNDMIINDGPFNTIEILGNSKQEWILRSFLEGTNLLAKSCKGAVILGGHEEYLQIQAYLFGRYLALAWHAKHDYDSFISNRGHYINLTSAPIMLHLAKDGSLYDEIIKGTRKVDECNFMKIYDIVHEGSALLETQEMYLDFAGKALNILTSFENNDARFALENIINAM